MKFLIISNPLLFKYLDRVSLYKSTLVSMLNSKDGEKLSKDRLRRVQASKSSHLETPRLSNLAISSSKDKL